MLLHAKCRSSNRIDNFQGLEVPTCKFSVFDTRYVSRMLFALPHAVSIPERVLTLVVGEIYVAHDGDCFIEYGLFSLNSFTLNS